MNRTPPKTYLALVIICFVVSATFPRIASATWSIVAADPRTGEIGSAGASCTGYVAGIVDGAPGRGIIVAQARSNSRARSLGVQMLIAGASPESIVDTVANREFDPNFQEQQYGIVSLGSEASSAAFTGTQTHGWSGDYTSNGLAIQGNTLTGPEVLRAMRSSFEQSTALPLGERLLKALEAGSVAGGDSRCEEQDALSAYLVVARPTDSSDNPYLKLIVPGQPRGGANPVHVLREQFDRWRETVKGKPFDTSM